MKTMKVISALALAFLLGVCVGLGMPQAIRLLPEMAANQQQQQDPILPPPVGIVPGPIRPAAAVE